jgi:hypothetical protein
MLTWLLGQLSPVFGTAVTDSISLNIQPKQSSRSQSFIDSNTTSIQPLVNILSQIPNKHPGAMSTEAVVVDSSSSLIPSLKNMDAVDKHPITELPPDFGEANPNDVARIIGKY